MNSSVMEATKLGQSSHATVKTPFETRAEITDFEILRHFEMIKDCANSSFEFSNDMDAEIALKNLSDALYFLIEAMYSISNKHGLADMFEHLLNEIRDKVKEYGV